MSYHKIYTFWYYAVKETKKSKTIFSKKGTRKRNMDLIWPIIFVITSIFGSYYGVIDLSNIQEFFSAVSKCLLCNKEKH